MYPFLPQISEECFKAEKARAIKVLKKLQPALYTENILNDLKLLNVMPGNGVVVVCIDAAFAVNIDKSSEMGVLVMPRNKVYGTVNIIHYSSSKSKRVCKSVSAAELFAFFDSHDVGYTINHTLQ